MLETLRQLELQAVVDLCNTPNALEHRGAARLAQTLILLPEHITAASLEADNKTVENAVDELPPLIDDGM